MSLAHHIAKFTRATWRSVKFSRSGLPCLSLLEHRTACCTTFQRFILSGALLSGGNRRTPIITLWSKRFLSASTGKPNEKTESKKNPTGMRLLALLVSAGLTFYTGYLLAHDRPFILDMKTFMHLLERGEVESVTVHPHRPYATVKLHTILPQADDRIILLSMHPSVEEFEKTVRNQEAIWGIPPNDQLPIRTGTSADFGSNRSTVSFLATAVLISAVFATAITYMLIKQGKLPQIKSISRRSFGAAGRATTAASPKPRTEKVEKPEPSDQSSDSAEAPKSADRSSRATDDHQDRFGSGLPFSWDPFSGFQTIKPVTTNVKFEDVAGLHASKQEVMEFVAYLKNPEKYKQLGAKLPKGALLLGPPGTGKTLLVKALANEAGVPFFSMAGSEFVEVIGGLGASRIRQLFRTARATPPAIIFIDELDSLGRRRSAVDSGGRGGGGGGGVSEMEQTLNQLLVEMDGMDTAEGTIVFAATNRADLLDKALLRAGRFDRHIYIDLPNLAERRELIAMYIAKYRLSPTIIQSELIEKLAMWTPGMSGADIARLCNEAALVTARHDNYLEGVTRQDFDVAFERVLAGAAKKSNPLSPPERRVAAVQEAGRALVAWLLPKTGLTPVKISIVPRTMAGGDSSGGLGFTHLVPEERRLFNTDELKDRMAVLLGGRAAEQVIFNAVSDASQRYLRAASDLAMKQVREWGLSKVIGNLSFQSDPSGSEYTMKPYSQRTQNLIELEAQQMVTTAFARCVDLLQQNRDKLQRIIDALLQQEQLTYEELKRLCEDTSEAGPIAK